MIGYIAAWVFFGVACLSTLLTLFNDTNPAWVRGSAVLVGAVTATITYLWIAGVRP